MDVLSRGIQIDPLVQVESLDVLDQKWYAKLKKVKYFPVVELLNDSFATREEAKENFLSSSISHPFLSYPNINAEKLAQLAQSEKALEELKKEILGEENLVIRKAYQWKINERIAELRLLRVVAQASEIRSFLKNNHSLNEEERCALIRRHDSLMYKFKKWSSFVYGQPSPKVFSHTLQSALQSIDLVQDSENPELIEAGRSLAEALPKPEDVPFALAELDEPPLEPPIESLFEKVTVHTRNQLKILLGDQHDRVIGDVMRKANYSPYDMEEIFKAVFINLKAEGWTALADRNSSRTLFSVDQGMKRVNIPATPGKIYSAQRLLELLVHEVGIHVQRRWNGEKSPLKLMTLGFDRYGLGEEGTASLVEDSIKGPFKDFFGLDRHLAISLALGLDGHPRNFREVFEIMKKYYRFQLLQLSTQEEEGELEVAAQNKAWDMCIRIFRGTDGSVPGVCYTKDMIYAEGNIAMWKVIGRNSEDAMEVTMGFLKAGKFDAGNRRHLWVMVRLGVIDLETAGLSEGELAEMDRKFTPRS